MKKRKFNLGSRVLTLQTNRKGVVVGIMPDGNSWRYNVKLIPNNGEIFNFPQHALIKFKKKK